MGREEEGGNDEGRIVEWTPPTLSLYSIFSFCFLPPRSRPDAHKKNMAHHALAALMLCLSVASSTAYSREDTVSALLKAKEGDEEKRESAPRGHLRARLLRANLLSLSLSSQSSPPAGPTGGPRPPTGSAPARPAAPAATPAPPSPRHAVGTSGGRSGRTLPAAAGTVTWPTCPAAARTAGSPTSISPRAAWRAGLGRAGTIRRPS